MILTPDEFQAQLYKDVIEPNLREGATLAFAHGFAIHYNQVVPRADLDVIMIAPKGSRSHRALWICTPEVAGIPDLVASLSGRFSGKALATVALSYASARIGGGRTGIIETTFKDE